MQLRRRLGIGILIVIIILLIAYGFRSAPVYVDVAPITRGPLQVTVEEEGKTRVVDRFEISAPVAGYARRIELNVGDAVKQGQALLQLEPLRSAVLDPRSQAEAKARVAATKDAFNAAQENARAAAAAAELAGKELARIQPLRKINHATKDEEDRAQAEARRAEAAQRSARFAVEVARHEWEAARTALQYSAAQKPPANTEQVQISSPIDGSVLKVHRESEGVVAPGQPLLELGDPRTLEVVVDVLSLDAVRIPPGTPVILERWGGVPLQGVVRLVEPVGFTKVSALGVEEQRVLVIADISSPPEQWQRLGDGYRVEARFILWQAGDVLQLPASALFHINDAWAVFVMRDGKAQRRLVKIGQRNGLVAQVLEGLSEGAAVITHPDDELADGVRVRLR